MFLSREETFANFVFLWRFAKVFSAKIYFQAIRYRASGCGALGCRKFAKVFSAKINFQAIRKGFLPRKKPAIRYIIYIYIILYIYIYIYIFFNDNKFMHQHRSIENSCI